jgi:hypothetical protein
VGISEIGRATVQLLDMNEEDRVIMRARLQAEGLLYPMPNRFFKRPTAFLRDKTDRESAH